MGHVFDEKLQREILSPLRLVCARHVVLLLLRPAVDMDDLPLYRYLSGQGL